MANVTIDLAGVYKKKAPVLMHGTSSLYLDRIKENGFGGIPVNREMCRRGLSELAGAFREANAERPSEDGEALSSGISAFVQSASGGVYVTTSIVTALDHACGEGCGFGEMLYELLAYYTAYKWLYGSYPELSDSGCRDFIAQFVDFDSNTVKVCCSPVVIVLRDVPVSALRREDGRLVNFTTKLTDYIKDEQHRRLKEDLPYVDTANYPLKDYLTKWLPSSQRYVGVPIDHNDLTVLKVSGDLPFFYYSDTEEVRADKEKRMKALRNVMADKLAELLL